MPLVNNVKEMRGTLGINQQELGTMVGVSRQTISLIERGDYSPSIVLAINIAKVFKVAVEDIFTITEEDTI